MVQAFWLVHRAPSAALLTRALGLLHALGGTAATAWGAAAYGGTLYLLTLLLPAFQGTPAVEEGLLGVLQYCVG